MAIHISRPRLLVVGVGLLALAAVAYAVAVESGDSKTKPTGIPFGTQPDLTHITAEERAAARTALEANPTFEQLTEGRAWGVVTEVPNIRDGQKVGLGLTVELSAPLDSNGPWKSVRCQGTVSYEFNFAYRGVSTLGTIFAAGGTRLIGLMPLPSESLSFDDTDVERQPPLPPCPKGYEDEEN